MGKDDTLLLGALGIGALIILAKPVQATGEGIADAVGGVGGAISDISGTTSNVIGSAGNLITTGLDVVTDAIGAGGDFIRSVSDEELVPNQTSIGSVPIEIVESGIANSILLPPGVAAIKNIVSLFQPAETVENMAISDSTKEAVSIFNLLPTNQALFDTQTDVATVNPFEATFLATNTRSSGGSSSLKSTSEPNQSLITSQQLAEVQAAPVPNQSLITSEQLAQVQTSSSSSRNSSSRTVSGPGPVNSSGNRISLTTGNVSRSQTNANIARSRRLTTSANIARSKRLTAAKNR